MAGQNISHETQWMVCSHYTMDTNKHSNTLHGNVGYPRYDTIHQSADIITSKYGLLQRSQSCICRQVWFRQHKAERCLSYMSCHCAPPRVTVSVLSTVTAAVIT